jgi:hypothetical protein
MYRAFALPWERRLVEEAHRLGLPSVFADTHASS